MGLTEDLNRLGADEAITKRIAGAAMDGTTSEPPLESVYENGMEALPDVVFRTSGYVMDLQKGGFLMPLTRGRSRFMKSRLVVLDGGKSMPVLLVLAEAKFRKWDELIEYPYWADGDWTNETLANVSIAKKSASGVGRARTSSLGVPSGTTAYMKAWRLKNPDRVRAAQKRYIAKRRELLASLKDVRSALPVVRQAPNDDVAFDTLFGKLDAAIKGVEDPVLDDSDPATLTSGEKSSQGDVE